MDSPLQSWLQYSYYVKSSCSHLSCSWQLFYAFTTVDRMTKPFICQGKKNHPVIFCVLSSERIRSSHHLPNKSHCQKDVDIKGLKEIMGKEIRRSSFLIARTAHARFKPLCTFLPRRQCRAETKLLGFGATQIKWPAMLSPE